MRIIPENYNCWPWLGAILIAAVASAFVFIGVYATRVELTFNNKAGQRLEAARDGAIPAGTRQTLWR